MENTYVSIDRHLGWTDFRMDKNYVVHIHQLTHVCTHTVKYYLATKKEMLVFETIWMKLKNTA